jgi:hypothetical protein
MAVVTMVGGRFRVGRGSAVSVGTESGVDSSVGLACGCVGVALSRVGELMVGSGIGNSDGVAVLGMCATVGITIGVPGVHAARKTNKQNVRKVRRNISVLSMDYETDL